MKTLLMQMAMLVTVALIGFSLTANAAVDQHTAKAVAQAVEKIVQKNLQGMQSNNADMAMSTIHPDSDNYDATFELTEQIMVMYQLKYSITNYQFIAYDGELAYARMTLLTEKIKGPEFNNNKIDLLMVFKQDKGVWKIWTQATIALEFL